eukprot:1344322-Lingulodinium_polyedra.AAC.1
MQRACECVRVRVCACTWMSVAVGCKRVQHEPHAWRMVRLHIMRRHRWHIPRPCRGRSGYY